MEKSQKSDVPPIRRQASVPVRHQYIFVDFQRTSCYNIATTPATHYANSYHSAAETGLYYLQSRYYDPAIGRFINADALVSTGQGLLGNNMFAYCGNNPVNRSDPSGYKWKFWRVLFEDHRPGYIHWAVEAHIVLGGLAQKELVLPGVGRADIYKPETGEIWEIKYGGSSDVAKQENTNKAIEQLKGYLEYKLGREQLQGFQLLESFVQSLIYGAFLKL